MNERSYRWFAGHTFTVVDAQSSKHQLHSEGVHAYHLNRVLLYYTARGDLYGGGALCHLIVVAANSGVKFVGVILQ